MVHELLTLVTVIAALSADAARTHDPGVLARAPYLGIACRTPNTSACRRAGVAVWLRGPARGIDVRVAGVPVAVRRPAGGGPVGYYEGYVVDPRVVGGSVYTTRGPVMRDVSVTVTGRDGTRRGTTVRTALAPGWG